MGKTRISSDSSGVNVPLLNNKDIEDENDERIVEPFQINDLNDPFPPNIIITSRYTFFSFIPKTIFEQFRRLANVYFLVLGIIAAIGANTSYYDTAVEPAGLLIPMTIVVLISIIKEGVEDIKRHQADKKTNTRHAHIIEKNGEVKITEWRNIVVGSLLLLLGDDEIPADCIILECGGVQGPSAYVETAAIDGETNLKLKLPSLPRNAPFESDDANKIRPTTSKVKVKQDKTQITGLDSYKISARVEIPNGSIHRFNGSLEVIEYDEHGGNYRTQYALTEKNLLLRGSILRASEWAVCLVVYTGKDTKLSLNSKCPPSKLSVVDSVVNRTLIIAISAMLIVCVISAIASIVWEIDNNNATYLCLSQDDQEEKYSGHGCESGSTNSALTILTFATLFNNFVCISMYVSLEMTYLWQAYFITQDLLLYDEISDSPAEAHTSGMCADLGQVQYVLSDKTGTLTKNIMKLRRCSVAGMIYGEPMDTKVKIDMSKQSDSSKGRAISFESMLSEGVSIWSPLSDLNRFRTLPRSSDQQTLLNFMRTLVLCNNAMLMPNQITGELNVTDKDSLKACLEAESADEVALVLACAEHAGIVLVKRDSTEAHVLGLTYSNPIEKLNSRSTDDSEGHSRSLSEFSNPSSPINLSNNKEKFDILAINEFDSRRKRMSVVIRIAGRSPMLLCKGADSSMFPVCVTGPYTTQCKEHVDDFASSGLRTLVMAKRDLTEEQFQSWFLNYKAASNSLVNRSEMLQRVAEEIEVSMNLLGAVGIEDELQDGVVKTIEVLGEAGLNLWMITGDKAETAVAIGRMCGLLKQDHELELLLKLSGSSLRQRLDDLVLFVEKTNHEEMTTNSQTTISSSLTQILKKTFANRDSQQSLSKEQQQQQDQQQQQQNNTEIRGSDIGRDSMISKTESLLKKERSKKEIERLTEHTNTMSNFLPSNFEDDNKSNTASFRSAVGIVSRGRPRSLLFKLALVVDGIILEEIMRDKKLLEQFITIARVINTVIACRVSPLQKASLVRMIKTGEGSPVTLAIGDGANDIGMIHEAKIGIGISGNEGRHAANNSDFSIAQFRFLAPLLLKHGRYNYIRSSKLVLYSFFKNLLLVSTLFYYSTFSGFSGTMPLESIVFSGYNFYLGLPIIAIGVMDMDVSYENVLRYPALAYATGKNRELLNLYSMGRWCISAFGEGCVLFAMVIRFVAGTVVGAGDIKYGIGVNNIDGKSGGIYVEGFLMFCCVILAMQYKVALMTSLWTWIHVVVWFLSIAGFILFASVYSQIVEIYDWYHVVNFTFHQGVYWLSLLLIPIAISLVDIFLERMTSVFAPSSQHKLHEILKYESMQSNTSSGLDLFMPKPQFNQEVVSRGKSIESHGSGYSPEDGVTLSRNASGDGRNKC